MREIRNALTAALVRAVAEAQEGETKVDRATGKAADDGVDMLEYVRDFVASCSGSVVFDIKTWKRTYVNGKLVFESHSGRNAKKNQGSYKNSHPYGFKVEFPPAARQHLNECLDAVRELHANATFETVRAVPVPHQVRGDGGRATSVL